LNVQIFIKMNRTDHAEKQLKLMQQADEDHTLTQFANAWVDIAVVSWLNISTFVNIWPWITKLGQYALCITAFSEIVHG
jgi:Coatomer epsilon subunit